MTFTGYSLFSTTLWANLAVLICILIVKNCISLKFDPKVITFFVLASMLRLVLCFETPFVRVIGSKHLLPSAQHWISERPTILPILLSLWGIGICVAFGLQSYRTIKFFCHVKSSPKVDVTFEHIPLADNLAKYITMLKIFRLPAINTPMISGILVPQIFLPDIHYTDEQLGVIIQHELHHFLHKDTLLKLVVEIVCIVFWWNPLIYLLRKELNYYLDIYCDQDATKSYSNQERIDYFKVIFSCVEASKNIQNNSVKIPPSFAGLSIGTIRRFEKRVDSVLEYRYVPKSRSQLYISIFLIMLLILFSYMFNVQPRWDPPSHDEEGNSIYTSELDVYLVEQEDGYAFYIDGIYKFSVNDITAEPYSFMEIHKSEQKGGN